ncbi:class I SAM-dependent methyltransferase [Terrihabitans sp. B22-R8]|uniref:class I SAM-dependent methyltransferase n=1 Tax=Terrihabitans sp. B22-R8 TaxID=3425128 RepID=UPI00403CB268
MRTGPTHTIGSQAWGEAFTNAQVEALGLRPDQTVLDLGAGSGRLAMPMARRAARVTALDRSSRLLARLTRDAWDAEYTNLKVVAADWDKVRVGRDLPRHDVVVAARFNGPHDLMKLDAAANERVCLMLFSGPSTRALHSALLEGIAPILEEEPVTQAGFVRLFNEMCECGLDPNVLHIPDGFTRWYPDEDAAAGDFRWMLPDASFAYNLQRNIRRFLIAENGGVRFLLRTRSTLIWWDK